MNSSLCGSTESSYDVAEGTGWGSASANISVDVSQESFQSIETSAENEDLARGSDSLLIGAWRGAPDGLGVHRLGGYYPGLLDNLEVRVHRWIVANVNMPIKASPFQSNVLAVNGGTRWENVRMTGHTVPLPHQAVSISHG